MGDSFLNDPIYLVNDIEKIEVFQVILLKCC